MHWALGLAHPHHMSNPQPQWFVGSSQNWTALGNRECAGRALSIFLGRNAPHKHDTSEGYAPSYAFLTLRCGYLSRQGYVTTLIPLCLGGNQDSTRYVATFDCICSSFRCSQVNLVTLHIGDPEKAGVMQPFQFLF